MERTDQNLRDILWRLVEILDYANISFDGGQEVDAVEIALEFDEIYLDACEALGMDLPERPERDGARAERKLVTVPLRVSGWPATSDVPV